MANVSTFLEPIDPVPLPFLYPQPTDIKWVMRTGNTMSSLPSFPGTIKNTGRRNHDDGSAELVVVALRQFLDAVGENMCYRVVVIRRMQAIITIKTCRSTRTSRNLE